MKKVRVITDVFVETDCETTAVENAHVLIDVGLEYLLCNWCRDVDIHSFTMLEKETKVITEGYEV